MNMTGKVQILLSTYNGEKYLKEQLDSLLNQDYENLSILIRDDGSKDTTIEILKGYQNNRKIKVVFGKNVGVINSFFELLKNSDEDSEFIAFCDQDDVWFKDKVSRAVRKLYENDMGKPLMYCSRTILVDENLNLLNSNIINGNLKKIRPSFENSLVENIATGCTVVINRNVKHYLLKDVPQRIVMHDWWIYLLVSAIGTVIWDNESRIYYRQHSGNVVGVQPSLFGNWKKRINNYVNRVDKYILREQAKEFLRIYRTLIDADKTKTIEKFVDIPVNLKDRIKYVHGTNIYRQNMVDSLVFKVMILLKMV